MAALLISSVVPFQSVFVRPVMVPLSPLIFTVLVPFVATISLEVILFFVMLVSPFLPVAKTIEPFLEPFLSNSTLLLKPIFR